MSLAKLSSAYCSRLNPHLARLDLDIVIILYLLHVKSPRMTRRPNHLTPHPLRSDSVKTTRFLGLPLDDFDIIEGPPEDLIVDKDFELAPVMC